ncbi:putative porin [Sphingomonas psychrotolerans]|nr:putative porin [Sphingomonas psychrotolerans]
MFQFVPRPRRKHWLLACAAGATLLASPALAQQVDSNKLLEIMVAKGLVTRAEADAMIAEARTAAPEAQAQAQALPPVPAGGVAADGTQTIPYVPQVVREQLVEQVRKELSTQAQTQGWAKPGELPEWTKRFTLSGDIRARADGLLMDSGNFTDFVDWSAINAGQGFQANDGAPGYVNPPYLNATRDRWAMRLRARLGLKARIDDWISAELRIATGNDSSPVSTNQTIGQHGEFGKYALWLDRANIHMTPVEGVDVHVGRFANPFWTSTLQFDEDLNFDGVALSSTGKVSDGIDLFANAGFFPLFNTSFDFGSRDAGVFGSKDRYLAAGQIGLEFHPGERLRLRLAGSYYRFENTQGEFSSPCAFDQDVCDTDATRPTFQQFGNTITALRNVTPNPAVAPGVSPEVQYFGLASKYEVVAARAEFDFGLTDRLSIRVDGDFIKNLAFDRSAVSKVALNNYAPMVGTTGGGFAGGDKGWQARLSVGHLGRGMPQGDQSIRKGDWNAHLGYRRIASDATLDALADSDFGLGGTNMKGWFAGGAYGFAENTAFGLRWLSADEVAGPPLAVDHLLVDLTTRF